MLGMIDYFTENPWPILFLLALVELVLIITIKIRGQGVWLKLAFAVPVVAVLVVVVELLIVTDREAVRADVRRMAQGIRAEDVDAIVGHISQAYDEGGVTFDTFRSNVTTLLDWIDLESAAIFFEEVKKLRDGRITARFKAITIGKAHGVPYGTHHSRWQLYYRCDDGQWKVCQIVPLGAQGSEAWPYLQKLIHGR